MKYLTALLVTALAVVAWWQQQRIETLEALVDEQSAFVSELRAEVRMKRDVADLFGKLIIANRKTILGLKRNRTLTVTAYSARPSETDDTPTITASNKPVRQGIVAVSRDLFDSGWVFGKKVYIKGHGLFTIDDLMARDKRNQLDIFMYDTARAVRFGKQTLQAHLIDL